MSTFVNTRKSPFSSCVKFEYMKPEVKTLHAICNLVFPTIYWPILDPIIIIAQNACGTAVCVYHRTQQQLALFRKLKQKMTYPIQLSWTCFFLLGRQLGYEDTVLIGIAFIWETSLKTKQKKIKLCSSEIVGPKNPSIFQRRSRTLLCFIFHPCSYVWSAGCCCDRVVLSEERTNQCRCSLTDMILLE